MEPGATPRCRRTSSGCAGRASARRARASLRSCRPWSPRTSASTGPDGPMNTSDLMVSAGSTLSCADTSAMVCASGVATSIGSAPGRGGRDGHPAGELDVGGIAARRAQRHVVLAGRAGRHELVRPRAAHHAGIRVHHDVAHAAALEDAAVRVVVRLVGAVERGRVGIEGVGVLHEELARPQHAGARPRLVALLGLDLVPDLGQVTVGPDLLGGQPRDDLLVRHAQAHVAAVAVLEPEHLGPDRVPAAGLLPDLGGEEHRHGDLLPADGVHLLADDGVDLVEHPLAEREVDVDAGGELADEAGPHHEAVAHRLRVGGVVAQGGDEAAVPAHPQASLGGSGTLLGPGTPGS